MVLLLDYESIILELCPALKKEELSKTSRVQFSGMGKKVLVVEDSPSVRAMLAAELSEFQFNVVVASDGVEALNMIRLDPAYDLVITDVEMPRMDGLALTVAVRIDEQVNSVVAAHPAARFR